MHPLLALLSLTDSLWQVSLAVLLMADPLVCARQPRERGSEDGVSVKRERKKKNERDCEENRISKSIKGEDG